MFNFGRTLRHEFYSGVTSLRIVYFSKKKLLEIQQLNNQIFCLNLNHLDDSSNSHKVVKIPSVAHCSKLPADTEISVATQSLGNHPLRKFFEDASPEN